MRSETGNRKQVEKRGGHSTTAPRPAHPRLYALVAQPHCNLHVSLQLRKVIRAEWREKHVGSKLRAEGLVCCGVEHGCGGVIEERRKVLLQG